MTDQSVRNVEASMVRVIFEGILVALVGIEGSDKCSAQSIEAKHS